MNDLDRAETPPPTAIARLRGVVAALAVFVVSTSLEAWTRVTILWRYRHDEPRRIAAMNRIIRVWGRATFACGRRCLGFKVVVQGEVPTQGRYLVVSNHQSSIDIPALFTIFSGLNLKFVAMRQLESGAPAVSLALRHGGFAFVGGQSRAKDVATLRGFSRDLAKHDGSPVIFPEGGRSERGALRPFAVAGVRIIRREAGLPVLPVAIEGLWRAPTIRELRHLAGRTVFVRVGEPIPFERDEDPRRLVERIEAAIRADLEQLRA